MAAFEESLNRLEAVVAKLEGGELTLEQSIELYEQGVRLSEGCRAELEKAEGRVLVLARGKGEAMKAVEFKTGGDDEPVAPDR
ncbi:MAG: exodeoxyribonuclease VII small subunit [Acidobacteriota bacterium]|nr:exodeoxyribonuclease VII small subunit [Acidobacteriota bacterium]